MTQRRERRRAIVILMLATLVAIGGLMGGLYSSPKAKAASTTTTSTTKPNTTVIPSINGYDLHYYSSDPGVPGGYFGPSCVPGKDPTACKKDIEERVKHDPMLCTVELRNFNLLPGVTNGMTPDQVEAVRLAYANKLAGDVTLRKDCADKVTTVFESMKDFHVEVLSGTFYTEYTDAKHQVTQSQKVMNPAVNMAIVGTTADGVVHMDKVDCGHQTVSPKPIPNVPTTPTPRPPNTVPPGTTPTTRPTTPTTCAPPPPGQTGCGKDARQDVLANPAVPPAVTGCSGTSATPSGTPPCPGGTAGPPSPTPDTNPPPTLPPPTTTPPTTAPPSSDGASPPTTASAPPQSPPGTSPPSNPTPSTIPPPQ